VVGGTLPQMGQWREFPRPSTEVTGEGLREDDFLDPDVERGVHEDPRLSNPFRETVERWAGWGLKGLLLASLALVLWFNVTGQRSSAAKVIAILMGLVPVSWVLGRLWRRFWRVPPPMK
jgi:hypothetical protein